jgi:hypothetical protein
MGTTADKLQGILNSKNAIKEKFNIADSVPFSQYANIITIPDTENIDVALGRVTSTKHFNSLNFDNQTRDRNR